MLDRKANRSTSSIVISGNLSYLARLIGTDEDAAAALIENIVDERRSREEAAYDEQCPTE